MATIRSPKLPRPAVVAVLAGAAVLGHTGEPGAARHFSFHFQNVGLREAIGELQARSGLELVYADSLMQGITVSCSWKDLTAEDALGRLLRGAGLGYRKVAADRAVVFPAPASEVLDLKGSVGRAPVSGASYRGNPTIFPGSRRCG